MKRAWSYLALGLILTSAIQQSHQSPYHQQSLITSLSQLPQSDQLDWLLNYLEENAALSDPSHLDWVLHTITQDVNPRLRSAYKSYIDRLVSRVMKKRAPEEAAFFDGSSRPIMTDIRMKKSYKAIGALNSWPPSPTSANRIPRATEYRMPLSDIRLRRSGPMSSSQSTRSFAGMTPLSDIRLKRSYGDIPLSDIRIKKDPHHIVPLSDIRLKKWNHPTSTLQYGSKRSPPLGLSDIRMKKDPRRMEVAEVFNQLVEEYPFWAQSPDVNSAE